MSFQVDSGRPIGLGQKQLFILFAFDNISHKETILSIVYAPICSWAAMRAPLASYA